MMVFADREDAGRQLAQAIRAHVGEKEHTLILGLPRGGVIVAKEVARVLRKPLDVVVVRKVGAPGFEELAIGAVGETGTPILNETMITSYHIPAAYVTQAVAAARREIARRVQAYRTGPRPDVSHATAVLVDDGIATGSTVEAAIATLREWGVARIVLAAPVAPREAVDRLARLVDDIVVLHAPAEFFAVGEFYAHFAQVSDAEVAAALRELSPTAT
jgi:predicted phosphoribosyltransferase